MNLKDTKMIVTGAAGGIGREICLTLAKEGAVPILVGKTKETLDKISLECQDHGVIAPVIVKDLSTAEACKSLVDEVMQQHGQIDGLINNAGVQSFCLLESASTPYIEKAFQINVMAVIHLSQAILPYFKAQNKGHIINIGSTFGSIGYAGFSIYSSTKFAVRGFTESIRRELDDTNINISYIAPRATNTSLNSSVVNEMNKSLGVAMDEPEKIAEVVLDTLLAKDKEVYIGWPERLFVKVNSVFPRVVDNALSKKLATIKQFAMKKAG